MKNKKLEIERKLEDLEVVLGEKIYSKASEREIESIASRIWDLRQQLKDYDKQFGYNPDKFLCDKIWDERVSEWD